MHTTRPVQDRRPGAGALALWVLLGAGSIGWLSVSGAVVEPPPAEESPAPEEPPKPEGEPTPEKPAEPSEPAPESPAPSAEKPAPPAEQPALEEPVPTGEPPEAEPPAEPPTGGDEIPGLDELLGTGGGSRPAGEGGAEAGAPGEAPPAGDRRLDEALEGRPVAEAFEEAVKLMNESAQRLSSSQDAGLATQRLQEEALRRLDELISQMEQMQQQSQSSSSQQSQDQRQTPRAQPDQQDQRQASDSRQGDNTQEMPLPSGQDAELRPELESARAAWGALPARVRDLLIQGSGDRFSRRYGSLTESFYRRLAEQRR